MRTSQVVERREKQEGKEREAGGCQATSVWLCQEHRMELECYSLHLGSGDAKFTGCGRSQDLEFISGPSLLQKKKKSVLA